MKELNEYKKEIFIRSAERIKERKRMFIRNSLVCVVLCFVMGISVLLIPPMLTVNEDASTVEDNIDGCSDADGAEADDIIPVYIRIEVLSLTEADAEPLSIANQDDIAEFERLIVQAFKDNYLYYDITEKAENTEDCDEFELQDTTIENVTEKEEGYTVTLTAADGYEKVIIIEGDILIDPELNMDITLTETRLEELKAILGLSD